jgi:hypothetical protein
MTETGTGEGVDPGRSSRRVLTRATRHAEIGIAVSGVVQKMYTGPDDFIAPVTSKSDILPIRKIIQVVVV